MTTASKILFAAFSVAALIAVFIPSAMSQETIEPENPVPERRVVSPEEALVLLAEEAGKGNANAMLTLGNMYERGIGAPRNFSLALEWYGKAAAAGSPEGYFNTGVCYEVGMGTAVDTAKAFANFENAAKLGQNQGLFKLATMYIAGAGTAKNEQWGIELLGRAAAAGNSQADNALGVISMAGMHGQAKDVEKAHEHFHKSAQAGNAEAMKNLAVFYRDGIGRPADPEQELKWYALARLAGFRNQAIDASINEVRNRLTGEQVQKVEREVQAWVKSFQESMEKAQQQRAQQQ